MRALLLCAALAAAGCGDATPSGYGIRFDFILDPAIGDGDVKRVHVLELESHSSIEPWYHRYDTGELLSGREAKMVYRPAARAGIIAFEARVRDDKDVLLGVGSVDVTLVPGAVVEAPVHLGTPPPIVIPPDMAGADMAAADM